MKRYSVVVLILLFSAVLLPAQEYSYLDPPTVSVMDFEVNIEEPLVGDQGNPVSKDYYGELINHSLVTVLIQKNRDFNLIIPGAAHQPSILPLDQSGQPVTPRDPHYKNLGSRQNRVRNSDTQENYVTNVDARYFPPLLKIYDKKYVETALADNNYTINDLYNKAPGAFNFPDLDFVILGNVFEYDNDKIAVNVRVLNTFRAEELFSYTERVRKDMTDLYPTLDTIARKIIIDIVHSYCAQFYIKEIEYGEDAAQQTRYFWPERYELFFQSSEELSSTADIITYNDTYKKSIYPGEFYWLLPGSYILTVYNKVEQTTREIPVEINPREIKYFQLIQEHFKEETGTITISNVLPNQSYHIKIDEKERDAQFLWEVGRDFKGRGISTEHIFKDGEFPKEENKDYQKGYLWSYDAATQQIVISLLPLKQYTVKVVNRAEDISEEDIFGILKISARSIESGETAEVNLSNQRNPVIPFEDFNLKTGEIEEAFVETRVTFLIPDAFTSGEMDFYFSDGTRSGEISFENYEKLIIESSYTEEEWNEFARFEIWVNSTTENKYFIRFMNKEALETKNDTIMVCDFTKFDLERYLRMARGMEEVEPAGTAVDTAVAVQPEQGEEKKGLAAFFQNLFGKKKNN